MLALRRPALAHSYENLLKRIKHTGTVMITDGSGKWYHSGNSEDVKEVVDRIKKVLSDEDHEEQRQFEMLAS